MKPKRPQVLPQARALEGGWLAGWKQDRSFVTALGRGLEVLRCFSEANTELGVSEIARLAGLPQPTAWRLCHTLLSLGYLATVPDSDKLRVGNAVLALGHSALPAAAAEDAVRPQLQRVADRFHAAVGLADRDRLSMMYLLRCRARPHLVMTSMRVGTRLALYKAGIGWAYVAGMTEAEREPLFQRIRERVGREWPETSKHLLAAIHQYAGQGFVTNCGVLAPGINTAAVPVRLAGGAHLALNCTGPEDLLTPTRLAREIGPELVALADKLGTLFPPHAQAV